MFLSSCIIYFNIMQLNIISLFYLFFRLAPFIIVCYFILQSVFNHDLKGVIYLVGLIISCFIAVITGSTMSNYIDDPNDLKNISRKNDICSFITLGNNGPVSKIPLGQVALSYTFFYILYIIMKYGLVVQNIASLILFPSLIVGDFAWNILNGCSSSLPLGIALFIGLFFGFLWGIIIDSTGAVQLQLFNGVSNNEVCSRPSRTMYRCRVRSGNGNVGTLAS